MNDLFFTISQAARELGSTAETIRKLCAAMAIPSEITPGGQIRIAKEVVEGLKRDGLPSVARPPLGENSRPAPASPRHGHPALLADVARHVAYEIEMLFLAARKLPVGFSSPSTQDEMNMALGSFLLHLRNLRGFLCPSLQPVCKDDVLASDYLGKLHAEDVGNPVILGRRKKRIDLQPRRERSWPVSQMTSDMRGELKQFLSLLPSERRDWCLQNQVVTLYLS
jgi:hypothetical protein